MFIIILYGAGGRSAGCDYTIGCNERSFILPDCMSYEGAKTFVENELEGNDVDQYERIEMFYIMSKKEFDLAKYKKQREDEHQKELEEAREKTEKALYERLKNKYGDK